MAAPAVKSPAQVSARADRLIAKLQALEGNVALFSHRQFGCVLAARWIGLPAVEGQHFALGPASLSILGHEASHPKTRVIALWNATPPMLPTLHQPARRRDAGQPSLSWAKSTVEAQDYDRSGTDMQSSRRYQKLTGGDFRR